MHSHVNDMPISPQPIKRYLPNFENNLPSYFLFPNKISGDSVHECAHGSTKHDCACTKIA